MANDVEGEYQKLKGLLEDLSRVTQSSNNSMNLHDAEMAKLGNSGNVQALDNLERNLRNARVMILSEFEGMKKRYG
jgi:hypothetical protein